MADLNCARKRRMTVHYNWTANKETTGLHYVTSNYNPLEPETAHTPRHVWDKSLDVPPASTDGLFCCCSPRASSSSSSLVLFDALLNAWLRWTVIQSNYNILAAALTSRSTKCCNLSFWCPHFAQHKRDRDFVKVTCKFP